MTRWLLDVTVAAGPAELGPGDGIAYSGDVPRIRDALEPGSTVVMALEHG